MRGCSFETSSLAVTPPPPPPRADTQHKPGPSSVTNCPEMLETGVVGTPGNCPRWRRVQLLRLAEEKVPFALNLEIVTVLQRVCYLGH